MSGSKNDAPMLSAMSDDYTTYIQELRDHGLKYMKTSLLQSAVILALLAVSHYSEVDHYFDIYSTFVTSLACFKCFIFIWIIRVKPGYTKYIAIHVLIMVILGITEG